MLLLSLNSYACELKNDEFTFSYKIDEKNKELEYSLSRKDGKEFEFVYLGKPKSIVGMILEKGRLHSSITGDSFIENYANFYQENNAYKKTGVLIISENPSMTDYIYKEKVKVINDKINYVTFISDVRKLHYKPIAFHHTKVNFTVRVVLDEKLKSCLNFVTTIVEYDFGSSFDIFNLIRKSPYE